MKQHRILALLLLVCQSLFGQWNPNTFINLEVSTLPVADLQTVITSAGKTWVAFYHANGGNYDMRAQLLDVDGTKLLGPDGILVDNQPSGTATFVYSICKDANDNLVIAYQDQRSGSQQAVVYKISQTGAPLWSSTGVVLGAGLAPYPAVLSNGETVISWNESGSNTLRLQKLSTTGVPQWSTPISVMVGTSTTTRGQIIPTLNGTFTLIFQRRSVGISTTLFAQRYDNTGTTLWTSPVQLSNQTTASVRYYSGFSEGDVTYYGYYSAQGSRFNSWLQRINADGSLPYGINGAAFSTASGSNDPYQQLTNIASTPQSSVVWSVCSFSNTSQSQYGIYVQKFDKQTGARLLTDNAQQVYSISASFDVQAGDLSLVNDAPFFMSYDANYKIYATRLDANGNFVWPGNRIELSSTTAGPGSPKGRYAFKALNNAQAIGVWTENRNGVEKAYAQNITPGGLFGLDVSTQGNVSATITTSAGTLQMVSTIFPATANQAVTWSIVPATGGATISTAGLVTASANGNVWAKATSIADNTLSDSLLITISGQGSVPAQGFTFSNPQPATAICGSATTLSILVGTTGGGGFSGPISLSATGQPAGTTVEFSTNPVMAGSGVTVTLNNINQLVAGTYTITLVGTSAGVTSQTINLLYVITQGAAPVISTSPQDATICVGATASFTVAANNGTYQWQQRGSTTGTWANIAGSTSITYSIANAALSLSGSQYRCVVTSNCGVSTSDIATLTVNAATTIFQQPASQTICAGSATTFSITAGGLNLNYQWQINTGTGFTNMLNDANYNGTATNSLSVTNSALSFSGNQYRCVVTGTCGSGINSSAATLTVHAPPTITRSPLQAEVCERTPASFGIAVNSIPPAIFQWQLSTNGGSSWNDISGATSFSLSLATTTSSMNNNRYRCLVSTTTCPSLIASTPTTLLVRAIPTVGLSAQPLTALLPGQTTTLTATPSSTTGGVITTQWNFNGQASSTLSGNTVNTTVANMGTYQVFITEAWPSGLLCSGASPLVSISATPSDKLFIYPSPNDGSFNLAYYYGQSGTTSRQINIYDTKGALVFQQRFTISGAYTILPIELISAAAGLYVVVVGDAAGNKLTSGKVIVR
jgi:hypothetical protein